MSLKSYSPEKECVRKPGSALYGEGRRIFCVASVFYLRPL